MEESAKGELKEIFGDRVTFDDVERLVYSHDVGTMPSVMEKIIHKLPDAVVQPESEEELVLLTKLSKEYNIPLVPRGKATSGYGGVLPVKGGIVVEFNRMKEVLDVDSPGFTVAVHPGVVWKDLEEVLNKEGLALRLYPTSAPSSTVGGWVAQGGGGIGSYEYGWFKDNIISLRVVLPTGEIKEFKGGEIDLISDAEGITGFIVQVTLGIRNLEAEVVKAVAFVDACDLAKALNDIGEEKLPLWSLSFINPEMASLKGKVPPRTHHGHVVEERVRLPAKYIALFTYPNSRKEEIEGPLQKITEKSSEEFLEDELAHHEWEERFNPMKVKRLGPSLISSEVVVPLKSLEGFLKDVEKSIKLPVVMESMVVSGSEVIILGFIPHDERKITFNIAYGLSLSILAIGKKHGGRAYSTGLYFSGEGKQILGEERLAKIKEYKSSLDKDGLMNPGKVIGNGAIGSLVKIAGAFEPVIRLFGNLAVSPIGEKLASIKGYPAKVSTYAYECAQCGYCSDDCTLYQGKGWESATPRGKWYFMKEVLKGRAKFDQKQVDNFLMCTTCEKCDLNCQLDLPIEPSWGLLRGELVHKQKKNTFPAFEIMAASLNKEKNIWARYREGRDEWVPEEIKPKIKDKAEVAYFAGCTASFEENNVAQGAVTLLDKAGVEFTYLGKDEACCGIPMLVAGKWDEWESTLRHNVEAMNKKGAKTVVTSCPACYLVWKEYYPQWAKKLGIDYNFKAKNYTEVISEKIKEGEFEFKKPVDMKVTFHDSCHIGRACGVYEPPRDVIKAIPGVTLVEMEHNKENALCCGSVLTRCSEPRPTSDRIGALKIKEAEETGADALVALCPCCEVQLRLSAKNAGSGMPVVDLAGLAAESLGYKFEDPTEHVHELWAVFDAMITLMKPENMVDLMAELMPQMVDAMPRPMGAMMKSISVLPSPLRDGILASMKPVMPKMLPILLPGMMPKIMPDMLKAVDRRVPMPDYMKEQMGDLMPKVMENLMPNMLPVIAPGVTDKMIECLKSGKACFGVAKEVLALA
jgi:Fe-S oxidoreductase/FAD/FMN-containing dehydrogenase